MSRSTESPPPIAATSAPALPAGVQVLPSGAIRFSFDHVPEHERVPVFREVFGSEVIKYDIEPLPDAPLRADVTLRAMPGLLIMSGRAHGSINQRTAQTIAAETGNDIGMIVNLTGPHRIVQGGQEIVLGDGDAALVSMGDVCAFTHRPPGEILALRVPLKELAALAPGVEDQCLRVIPKGVPALKLLTDYARLAQDDQGMTSPELQHLVVRHVQDLMALAVGASRDGSETAENRGLRAARLHAIKQDIARNIDQPDLSVTTLASRHGCTPRFIQRLFETEATTFTDYVIFQRLARAHRMLTDPRYAGDKISTVAYECGFGDVSYFNRVFRRTYGAAPSDVRAQARRAAHGLPDAPARRGIVLDDALRIV